MADPKKMVAENVDGDFFVDKTCINCDTCRQLAPATFKDQGDYSYVYEQPLGEQEIRAATRALLCCPTGSIGTIAGNDAPTVMQDLPMRLDENVFYCGFNSPKSYGANSFFIQDEGGNWLIDSPKFVSHLVERLKAMGGIKYIFLTHQDDVADAARFAFEFGATCIIHRADLHAYESAEMVIDGDCDVRIDRHCTIIPVPGHTKGHMVLLYKDKFLFTGDHLAYDPEEEQLIAFRNHCWYSWTEQIKSMQKLSGLSFEWVLAGHGDRIHLDAAAMQEQLRHLIARMRMPAA